MESHSNALGSKSFVYFSLDTEDQAQEQQQQQSRNEREFSRDALDKLLRAIGKEALKERTPSLQELEQTLK